MTIPATAPPPAVAAAAALAHPSRRRIAAVLSGSPWGLTVTQVAQAVGLHRNAARRHLQALAAAGVAAAERGEARGRGRPGLRYRLVDPGTARIAAHQELVALLVGLLVRAGLAEDEIERFGRENGRLLAEAGGAGALIDGFARLAFAPREVSSATEREHGTLELSLEHCPFREAVGEPGGELICVLHRGLSQGMADRAAAGTLVTEFTPRNPSRAGCRVRFELPTERT
jgi:predicted ArsR family transcriptional regulator